MSQPRPTFGRRGVAAPNTNLKRGAAIGVTQGAALGVTQGAIIGATRLERSDGDSFFQSRATSSFLPDSFERELENSYDEEANEAEMSRYIGKNWPKYRKLWKNMRESDDWKFSFTIIGFCFTVHWLIYRRQYLWAFVYLFGSLCLIFVNPKLLSLALFVTSLFFACYGKAMILKSAMTNIQRIKERTFDATERRAYIERAGGTNIAGAIASMVLISVISGFIGPATVGEAAKEHARQSPTRTSWVTPSQSVSPA